MSTTVFSLALVPDHQDSQIAAQALGRLDPDAIDALVELHAHRLLRYLLHLTGDRSVADDLFQETWLRVLERGHQYDPSRPFVGWLLGIARHLTVDALRLRRPASLEELEARSGEPPERPRTAAPSPFESLVARERRDRIAAAASGLPAVYREVLYLRFQEDMSLEEIARLTKAPVPTVKSRLYRGLENMALRLGEGR
jgi:RNA polymerase sigma-70 factor (ECF subfamily)